MPTGTVIWFDRKAGEGRVASRAGREYLVRSADIATSAAVPGARVSFQIDRERGARRAFGVQLRRGTRNDPGQGRFGDLTGAHHPDDAGGRGLGRKRPVPRSAGDLTPAEVAQRWVAAVARGDRMPVLALYSASPMIHAGDVAVIGRGAIQRFLDQCPLLGRPHEGVDIKPRDGIVTVTWRHAISDRARFPGRDSTSPTRLRIAHGRIEEQWT
jgi:cold shock CspA family protein